MVSQPTTSNITGNLFPNGGALPIMVNNKLPLTFMITNSESINKSFTVTININSNHIIYRDTGLK